MPTREEMNSLAQGIISSYGSRIMGVSQIRRETQSQLRQLDRAHQAMAQQLRADLGQAESARQQEEAQRARDRTQVVAHSREDEAQRARDRGTVVAHRKSGVNAQLQELDRAHNAMAQQLRVDLNQAETARRQDEAQRARDRTQVVAHSREDEAQRARDRGTVVAHRKSDVNAQLQGYRDEQAGARQEWQRLVHAMAGKRNGGVAVAEAPPRVAPPPPVVRVAAPAITAEEDAVERVVVGEVTTEFASLSDRVFVYLANHPDGTRLTELEREIGLSRFQAARAVRHLIDEGKTEKRDFCYFAI